jgi:hypothetical protein
MKDLKLLNLMKIIIISLFKIQIAMKKKTLLKITLHKTLYLDNKIA